MDALGYAHLCADSNFIKVSNGVHSLCEPHLGRLLCPEVCLGVRLEEHTQGANKVPRGERKACVTVALLCCDVLCSWSGGQCHTGRLWTHVLMDGECGVLQTAHLAVLIALAQAVCTQCVAKLAHLCEQLGGVLAVDKDNVVNAALMEEGELMEHMGELGGGVLPGAFEPLDALTGALREAKLTIEYCLRVRCLGVAGAAVANDVATMPLGGEAS